MIRRGSIGTNEEQAIDSPVVRVRALSRKEIEYVQSIESYFKSWEVQHATLTSSSSSLATTCSSTVSASALLWTCGGLRNHESSVLGGEPSPQTMRARGALLPTLLVARYSRTVTTAFDAASPSSGTWTSPSIPTGTTTCIVTTDASPSKQGMAVCRVQLLETTPRTVATLALTAAGSRVLETFGAMVTVPYPADAGAMPARDRYIQSPTPPQRKMSAV